MVTYLREICFTTEASAVADHFRQGYGGHVAMAGQAEGTENSSFLPTKNLASPSVLMIFVCRRLPANEKMNISVVSETLW
jgi:hypothetical protein